MDILKRLTITVSVLCLIFYVQYLYSQSSSKLTSRISIDNSIKFPKDI